MSVTSFTWCSMKYHSRSAISWSGIWTDLLVKRMRLVCWFCQIVRSRWLWLKKYSVHSPIDMYVQDDCQSAIRHFSYSYTITLPYTVLSYTHTFMCPYCHKFIPYTHTVISPYCHNALTMACSEATEKTPTFPKASFVGFDMEASKV